MPTIVELQEKREKLIVDARAALDEVGKNTDESRAAELEKRHDDIMAEFDRLGVQIEREQRLADAQKAVEERAAEDRKAKRPVAKDAGEQRGQADGSKPEYREVFYKYLSRGGSLDELSPEERAVLKDGVKLGDEQRAQVSTQGTSTTAGGYTVPVELDSEIVRYMKAWGPMYDEAITNVISTSTGVVINIPTIDDTTVTAGAHSEGAAMGDTGAKDATFGKKSLESYAYDTQWIRVSMELARDSILNMESLLGSLLGERLGRIANLQLTTGNGVSNPNGIVTASTKGKDAAAAAAITYDEVIDLIHSVDPAYRMSPKTRFMFNDLSLASLRKLKDGEGRYIWSAGSVKDGTPGTLFGYPYSINQAMDGIASGKKSILFGDFGKYFVRRVGGTMVGVRREYYWPDIGIAGVVNLDGELVDTSAVRHLLHP